MTKEQKEKFESVKDFDSVKNFKVELLEIAGLHSVLEALHLPFGKGSDSKTEEYHEYQYYTDAAGEEYKFLYSQTRSFVTTKDVKLIHTLVKNGDEHAKAIRGIVVYLKITAPRYLWSEIDTYRIGTDRLASNSTMHQECKKLPTAELVKAKEEIKEKLMQTRIQMFSYQSLRRLYFQRRNHRLPQWWLICDMIEKLPFAEEWITFENK